MADLAPVSSMVDDEIDRLRAQYRQVLIGRIELLQSVLPTVLDLFDEEQDAEAIQILTEHLQRAATLLERFQVTRKPGS